MEASSRSWVAELGGVENRDHLEDAYGKARGIYCEVWSERAVVALLWLSHVTAS